MKWIKGVGKWFKGRGEDVSKGAKKVGEGIGDVAEEVVESSKFIAEEAVNKTVGVVNKVGDLIDAPDIPEVDFSDRQTFVQEKKQWVEGFIQDNGELIKQALEVAGNLAKHGAEIKSARKDKKLISDSILASTGANELKSTAADDGYKSFSFGSEVDASLVVGASGSMGISINTLNADSSSGSNVAFYTSVAGQGGITVGLDGTIELGFWKDPCDEIGGVAHGLVVGGSYGGGAALSFWWKMGGGEFAGWTVCPQAGASIELEYNIGKTWVST